VKSGSPEGYAFPAPHATPIIMSHMSYQGTNRTYDKQYHGLLMSLVMVVTETR